MNSILDDYKKMYGDLELDNLRLKQKNSSFFVNEEPGFFDISLIQHNTIPYIPLQISSMDIAVYKQTIKNDYGLLLPPFNEPKDTKANKTLRELAWEIQRPNIHNYYNDLLRNYHLHSRLIELKQPSKDFAHPIKVAKPLPKIIKPFFTPDVKPIPKPKHECILQDENGSWVLVNHPIDYNGFSIPTHWDMVDIGDTIMLKPIGITHIISAQKYSKYSYSYGSNINFGKDSQYYCIVTDKGITHNLTDTIMAPTQLVEELTKMYYIEGIVTTENGADLMRLCSKHTLDSSGVGERWSKGRESLNISLAVYKWYPKESMNTLSFDHEFPAG
jgi:hypothetical protein